MYRRSAPVAREANTGRPTYRGQMGRDDSHDLDDDDAIAADSDATAAEGGSGEGGDLGTPSSNPQVEEPPSEAQERNEAVSGGGMANTTEDDEPGPELPE